MKQELNKQTNKKKFTETCLNSQQTRETDEASVSGGQSALRPPFSRASWWSLCPLSCAADPESPAQLPKAARAASPAGWARGSRKRRLHNKGLKRNKAWFCSNAIETATLKFVSFIF